MVDVGLRPLRAALDRQDPHNRLDELLRVPLLDDFGHCLLGSRVALVRPHEVRDEVGVHAKGAVYIGGRSTAAARTAAASRLVSVSLARFAARGIAAGLGRAVRRAAVPGRPDDLLNALETSFDVFGEVMGGYSTCDSIGLGTSFWPQANAINYSAPTTTWASWVN
jgi:hypothetical protein